jgi:hypothetical protein
MIAMNPVNDSYKVVAVGYDPATQTLAARLRDGSAFEYAGVTPKMWEELLLERFNVHFDYIKGHHTATPIVQKEDASLESLPAAARIVEMQLIRDFGEKGTHTCRAYEELKARLDALPTSRRVAEFERVTAQLAAIPPTADVEDVARLLSKQAALSRIIAAGEAQVSHLTMQIDSVRAGYASDREAQSMKTARDQARRSQAETRLAELTRWLADPYAPHIGDDGEAMNRIKKEGLTIAQARDKERRIWEKQQDELRAFLVLPAIDRTVKKVAFVNQAG